MYGCRITEHEDIKSEISKLLSEICKLKARKTKKYVKKAEKEQKENTDLRGLQIKISQTSYSRSKQACSPTGSKSMPACKITVQIPFVLRQLLYVVVCEMHVILHAACMHAWHAHGA